MSQLVRTLPDLITRHTCWESYIGCTTPPARRRTAPPLAMLSTQIPMGPQKANPFTREGGHSVRHRFLSTA